MAHSVPKGSCASRRTQDERGQPKALIASQFFAAEIGRTPFQLSRKMLALLDEVATDLQLGKQFYDSSQIGIGDYFFDSLIADIESLKLYAGIHSKHHGLYRMLAKRFPFAIYYDLIETTAIVIAVLDLRRNPFWIRTQLQRHPAEKP